MPPGESGRREGPVVAICGKGGVGKTAVTALVARALLDQGVAPLLLIDADPVGGLRFALGETDPRNLADVRARVLAAARGGGSDDREVVARELDFMVAEALIERQGHALLAMGRSTNPGCFCSVNKLLRDSIDVLCGAFALTLIDAEAGVEQINREVTRRTSAFVVVLDGSDRSVQTLHAITAMVPAGRVGIVANRWVAEGGAPSPQDGTPVLGVMPEDDLLRRQDRSGQSLWDLPAAAPSGQAAREIAAGLIERWVQKKGDGHA